MATEVGDNYPMAWFSSSLAAADLDLLAVGFDMRSYSVDTVPRATYFALKFYHNKGSPRLVPSLVAPQGHFHSRKPPPVYSGCPPERISSLVLAA